MSEAGSDSQNTAEHTNSVEENPNKKESVLSQITEIAAVIQDYFTSEFIARLIRIPIRGAGIQLRKLVKKGVLEQIPDSQIFCFRDSDHRDRVYNRISNSRLLHWHRVIHKMLIHQDKQKMDVNRFQIAYHGLAGRIEGAVRYAVEIAGEALNAGKDEDVWKLIREIKKHFPEDSAGVLLEARLRLLRGDFQAAVVQLVQIHNRSRDSEGWGDLHWAVAAGEMRMRCGHRFRFNRFYDYFMKHHRVEAEDRIICLTGLIRSHLEGFRLQPAVDLTKYYDVLPDPVGIEQRSRLNQALAWIDLVQDRMDQAEARFMEELPELRQCANKMAIAQAMLSIAWLHYYKGEMYRARRTLLLVSGLKGDLRRPFITLDLAEVQFLLSLDDGKIAEAEGYLDLYRQVTCIDELGFIRESRLDLLTFKLCLRKGDIERAAEILFNRFSIDKKVFNYNDLRIILSSIPDRMCRTGDLLGSVLKQGIELLKSDEQWAGGFLSEVLHIRYQAIADGGRLDCHGLRDLYLRAEREQDILAKYHITVLLLQMGDSKLASAGICWSGVFRELNHPLLREHQADLVYYVSQNYSKKEKKDVSRILERVLQSQAIAARIKDSYRIQRAQNAAGAMIAGSQAGVCVRDGEIPLLGGVDQIQVADDAIRLQEVAAVIFKKLYRAESGRLIELSEFTSRSEFRWGRVEKIPESRMVLREYEKMVRSMESSREFQDRIWLIRIDFAMIPRAVLVLNIDSSRSPVRLDQVCEQLQVIGRTLVLALDRIRSSRLGGEDGVMMPDVDELPSWGIVGRSEAVREIFRTLERIKDSPATVHITGETGVGKEVVARAIHQSSSRCHGPFLGYNCAASPEHLIESELFGHVKGAFTGAIQQRDGLFFAAHEGTLFLDEVGELPMTVQVKLLRVLQERCIRPVGADKEFSVNVRIVSATHRDLAAEVAAGRFREDLYYRLHVLEIHVPPLRERSDDIPLLVRFFIRKFSDILGRDPPEVSRDALDLLLGYAWPGNVRELQNVIEVAINLMGRSRTLITPEFMKISKSEIRGQKMLNIKDAVMRAEMQCIRQALAICNGNQTKAAAVLGISRQALFKKINRYSIIR